MGLPAWLDAGDRNAMMARQIIAKFLDLEIFEKKFKLAKDDSTDLKGALKRLESRNYDEEIEGASTELNDKREELEDHKTECEE